MSRLRSKDDFYGITVDVIGQTKVTGNSLLTNNLASSVLSRQMEKDLTPGVAKFLPDRVHFSRSGMVGQKSYRRDIPYNDVKKMYTFDNRSDVFMLCIEGDFEAGRIYQSFKCRNPSDMTTVNRMIYGDNNSRGNGDCCCHVSNAMYSYDQPQQPMVYPRQYMHPPRTPSPILIERAQQERESSPIYVRRPVNVKSGPVYMTEPERHSTSYMPNESSPILIRHAQMSSQPNQVIYVDDHPQGGDESVVIKRQSLAQSNPNTLVRRASTTNRMPNQPTVIVRKVRRVPCVEQQPTNPCSVPAAPPLAQSLQQPCPQTQTVAVEEVMEEIPYEVVQCVNRAPPPPPAPTWCFAEPMPVLRRSQSAPYRHSTCVCVPCSEDPCIARCREETERPSLRRVTRVLPMAKVKNSKNEIPFANPYKTGTNNTRSNRNRCKLRR